MINYRNKVSIQKSGESWYITTDKTDRYETFPIDNTKTPWGKWWEMQNQSDLRSWQKDLIRDIASKWTDLTPYMVYKRNAGYSQPHDIALAHSQRMKVWILSTESDFWIVQSDYGQVDFHKDQSMGSVLDQDTRSEIGIFRDLLDYQ